MTPSDLKYHIEQANTETHFFSRKTMKFFGDSMRNYGVRSATVKTNYDAAGEYVGKDGVSLECWELYRKQPVKCGISGSAYFDKQTFAQVYPSESV